MRTPAAMSPSSTKNEPVPRRPFGRHPDPVSIIGLGGYHLGKAKTRAEAVRIVHEAIDAGINFLDNAWEYHEGESEQRMGRAIEDRRESVFLMTKVCTHGRDGRVAMRQLDESLRRLRTDYLDLWQIHECVYYNDPDRHFARGGVVEALEQAKEQGKVRYVGFTGHKDPEIHLRMLSFDFPFDACQLRPSFTVSRTVPRLPTSQHTVFAGAMPPASGTLMPVACVCQVAPPSAEC